MRIDLLQRGRGLRAAKLSVLLISVALGVASAGCAGASPGGAEDASTSATAANAANAKGATAAPAPKAAPGHLLRSDVDQALSQGPAWLLQRVEPDAVIRSGAFVGWRIVSMPEAWVSAGLQPGDVVTRVNGASIERPDDLWKTWVALTTVAELKIGYQRDGAAKDLVMPIDGAPTLSEAALAAKAQPQPQPQRGRQVAGRRETIVIPSGDAVESGSDEEK